MSGGRALGQGQGDGVMKGRLHSVDCWANEDREMKHGFGLTDRARRARDEEEAVDPLTITGTAPVQAEIGRGSSGGGGWWARGRDGLQAASW